MAACILCHPEGLGFSIFHSRSPHLMNTVLSRLVSITLLTALAIPLIYISFLSPIVGDTWNYVAAATRFNSVFDPFAAYGNSYWVANPRLGQLFLFISGVSASARVLVNFISLAALTLAAFTIITGRCFRPHVFNDVLTIALFLSLMWIIHQEIGLEFFYTPYTTNYVLGYATLLFFLIPYRLAMLRPHFNFEHSMLFAMLPLGLAAGLTNEHTSPIYIIMIGLALMLVPMTPQRQRWMAVGLAGLLFGYLLLFFAPGQSKRYGGVKYEAWEAPLSKKIEAAEKIAAYFADGWAIALLAGVVITIFVLWRVNRRGSTAEQGNASSAQSDVVAVGTLLLVAAIGMALPLVVSPMLGPRLLFASHVNLAMAASAILLAISNAWAWRTVLSVLVVGINAAYLWKAYLAYSVYQAQFRERAGVIESQKAASLSPVIVPNYTIKFGSLQKYVYREPCSPDPAERLNRARAFYFGVESLVLECPLD
jgi:hypothetical protein